MGRGTSPAWESCPAYLEVKYSSRDKIGLYLYLEKNTGVEREPSPGPVTLGLVCLGASLEPPCPHPHFHTPLAAPLRMCPQLSWLACPQIAWSYWKNQSCFLCPPLLGTQRGTSCNSRVIVDSQEGMSFLEWKLGLGRS